MERDRETAPRSSPAEYRYRRMLAAQVKSGLTRCEFARKAGIKEGTLAWWQHEIRRRERMRRTTAEPSFLPVRVRDEPRAEREIASRPSVGAVAGTPYEVVLGKSRVLRIPRDFDVAHVRMLVGALEVVPC